MLPLGLLLIAVGIIGSTVQEKKGLKKTLITAKVNFFAWIQAVIFLVRNFDNIQKVIDHQNRELEETRLLVNFLLKNTNRYIRRRWIRYLDRAQEAGIWDAGIVKLHPREPLYRTERTPQEVVNLMDREIPIEYPLGLEQETLTPMTVRGDGELQ